MFVAVIRRHRFSLYSLFFLLTLSSLSIYLCSLSLFSLWFFFSFSSSFIFSPLYSQLSTLYLPSLCQFIYFLSSLRDLLYSIYTLPLSIIESCLGMPSKEKKRIFKDIVLIYLDPLPPPPKKMRTFWYHAWPQDIQNFFLASETKFSR